MQVEAKFYERLHATDTGYGLARYDVPRLLGTAPFRRWRERMRDGRVRLLEIACGKGQFLLDLTTALKSTCQLTLGRVAVVDLVRASNNVLDQVSPRPEFNQQSVDGTKLPFPDGSFDLVVCNHVLEHLFQTENLVREIRRVCAAGALAEISVPNTAAWMNRLAFLFGGQPLGSEVGVESVAYGFWPGFLQGKLAQFNPSGHIRDFTPRSLRDLTTACGFRHAGWWAQNGGPIPTLGRNLGIVLEPA